MLVDNAIVVTDNAQIAIARGIDRRKALIDGATGPQWGLLGATFIAICSFLPLYLAPSSVAEIVKPLFVVLGHFPGIKLGAGADADHCIRQLHTESQRLRDGDERPIRQAVLS